MTMLEKLAADYSLNVATPPEKIARLRADLLELTAYANANRKDERARAEVSRALSALVFHDSHPAEHRGVDCAGLTIAELNDVYAALPTIGCIWKTAVMCELDSRAEGSN